MRRQSSGRGVDHAVLLIDHQGGQVVATIRPACRSPARPEPVTSDGEVTTRQKLTCSHWCRHRFPWNPDRGDQLGREDTGTPQALPCSRSSTVTDLFFSPKM